MVRGMTHSDPFDIPLSELRQRRSMKWSAVDADVLPLWIAEMDVRLPEPVRSALHRAIDLGDTGYPGSLPGFAASFADFAHRTWGWDIDPGLCRGFPDLAASGQALLRHFAGDDARAVITPPVYNNFFAWLRAAGITGVEVPVGPDGAQDLDGIEAAFADGVRVALISNPHNPLGRIWTDAELERLADLAARYDAFVIADEIHAPVVHPGRAFRPFLTISDDARRRGVALHSASKGFNIAGLKSSLLITAADGPHLPDELDGFAAVGHLGALASEVAFSPACDDWFQTVREGIAARTAHVATRVTEEIPGARADVPEASYLVWADLREPLAADLAEGRRAGDVIRERGRVQFADGEDYGREGRGFVRINCGTSWEVLDEAIDRLVAACRGGRSADSARAGAASPAGAAAATVAARR
ncbi:aminotransferase class I/II-fold pyridoxal phosphate-dependent enzyme [Helcobacillus massiliensis]